MIGIHCVNPFANMNYGNGVASKVRKPIPIENIRQIQQVCSEMDDDIRKPTILLTSPTFSSWSASNWRLTTSPLTSLRPSPCFGVTSTLVMFIMAAAPTGMILWR